MRKLFKVLLIFTVINFAMGFSFLGWLGYNLVSPSLEGTGITFTDFLSKDLDPEKYATLEKNMSIQAEKLGTESGQKFVAMLEKLFPAPDFDYSDLPPVEYPYPSLDEVLKMNEENAQKGIEQGLQNLRDQEEMNKKAIQQGLEYLKESEKQNQAIKEQTLSTDNN